MIDKRPKTLILDIDGTLIKHKGDPCTQCTSEPEILPGVLEKFQYWDRQGYNIILLTGRRESERESTEKQLSEVGIFYDQLVMGVGGGPRILINDTKPVGEGTEPTAIAIIVERNKGLENIDV